MVEFSIVSGDGRPEQENRSSEHTEHTIVVSTDSHTGPSLDVLRNYCPRAYLDTYDDFANDSSIYDPDSTTNRFTAEVEEVWERQTLDPGVNDPRLRLKNMDDDGIAAEVIFHGTGSPHTGGGIMPFLTSHGDRIGQLTSDTTLQTVGKQIYNRWLAAFCSEAPERLVGVVELPFWDIDAAVKEVKWAGSQGFRAVNFAGPRMSMPTYDDPVWEPFWAAVEDADVTLNCHSGVKLHEFPNAGVAYSALVTAETHFVGRLPLAMMSFSGVFKRHPTLRVIFNEQRAYWVPQGLRDLDSIYFNPWNQPMRDLVENSPSEFWRRNCFVGGSFLAHFELQHKNEIGLETITWGRDYPHVEGTWPYTKEALRAAFFDLPPDDIRQILGDNAIRCYRLDAGVLATVAAQIGPTIEQITEPLGATPEDAWSWAFRDRADAKGGARFGAF
jgi:predicted TIM-barrel fold metal-dependent hydrolase